MKRRQKIGPASGDLWALGFYKVHIGVLKFLETANLLMKAIISNRALT